MGIARIDQRFSTMRRALLVAVMVCTGGAAGVLLVAIALGAASSPNQQDGTEHWVLTWSDEFNGRRVPRRTLKNGLRKRAAEVGAITNWNTTHRDEKTRAWKTAIW